MLTALRRLLQFVYPVQVVLAILLEHRHGNTHDPVNIVYRDISTMYNLQTNDQSLAELIRSIIRSRLTYLRSIKVLKWWVRILRVGHSMFEIVRARST